MIYEAILRSAHTDFKLFYGLRGKEIHIEEMIYDLNYFYKYDKETWIRKKGKAIKRENEENALSNLVLGNKENSRLVYAAYVYLVLKVHLEHPFLYKLINV
jgi:hypothetical protein